MRRSAIWWRNQAQGSFHQIVVGTHIIALLEYDLGNNLKTSHFSAILEWNIFCKCDSGLGEQDICLATFFPQHYYRDLFF